MGNRQAIYINGFNHKNPVPNASRIGNLVMSGVINGSDPESGEIADGLDAQCRFMFQHMKSIVQAAGGTVDDILKVTVWMKDRSQRDPVNREWLAMFPDEASRPARHALPGQMEGRIEIQCDFVAVIAEAKP